MTRHVLQGRVEDELLWFHRRSFLQAAAAWTAAGGFAVAHAQQRGNDPQPHPLSLAAATAWPCPRRSTWPMAT